MAGSGLKRSAYIDILDVGNGVYTGEYEDTGVCFGDSGCDCNSIGLSNGIFSILTLLRSIF